MKKEFTAPEMELLSLEVADVITTSLLDEGADTD